MWCLSILSRYPHFTTTPCCSQGELQVSQQINEQFQAGFGGLDVDGLSDVAEQIAELGTLRQKSMEVNAFQAENEDAMEALRQQHAAAIGSPRGRIQDRAQPLEALA